MAIPLTLRVFRADELVQTREYHRGIIRIGSLATAQLAIDDPRVSRIHAVLEAGDDGISITDMGSVEGTYVNGKRINKVSLSSGDAILVGGTRIEVLVGVEKREEAPAAATPAAATPAAATPAAATPAAATPAAAAPAAATTAAAAPAAATPAAATPAAAAPAAVTPAAATPAAVTPAAAAPAAASHQESASFFAPPAEAEEAIVPAASSGETPIASSAARPSAPAPSAAPVETAQQAAPPEKGEVPSALGFTRPAPWPREHSDRPLALDLRFFWGDKQLLGGVFDEEAEITVGEGKEVTFPLEAAHLPEGAFPLARKVDGAWHLRYAAAMDGELVHGGKIERLGDLARERRATPVGDGVAELELPADGAVWLDLGNIRAELCFRPKTRPIAVPLAQRLDYSFINIFLVAFVLVTGAIISFKNTPVNLDVTADDLYANQARFTKLLLTPPEQRPSQFLDRLKLKAPEGEGIKAPGEEGKAGKRDAPERNTRSAPKAIQPSDEDVIKNQGILAMLGSGGNTGLSTIFGKEGLGGDLKGAIGGITGSSVGDAHGFGGLGLKGTGLGGGGEGTVVGVGAIGTKGRGGGSGDYGKGAGEIGTKKESAEIKIDSSSVIVVGYDRELVRRVVHANRSQLRFCYENELIRDPQLQGRVAINWTITSDGTVAQPSIAETSLKNARVESCLLTRVRGWNFPPPKGGGIARITYPFIFNPAG